MTFRGSHAPVPPATPVAAPDLGVAGDRTGPQPQTFDELLALDPSMLDPGGRGTLIEFDVKRHPLTANDLRGAQQREVEYMIFGSSPLDAGATRYMSIGDADSSSLGKDDIEAERNMRVLAGGGFTLHTHPAEHDQHVDRISPKDILSVFRFPENTMNFMVDDSGIKMYGKASRHPTTGEPIDVAWKDMVDLLTSWANDNGLDLESTAYSEEDERLMNEFCRATGIYRTEIAWSEQDRVDAVLDVINGTEKPGNFVRVIAERDRMATVGNQVMRRATLYGTMIVDNYPTTRLSQH